MAKVDAAPDAGGGATRAIRDRDGGAANASGSQPAAREATRKRGKGWAWSLVILLLLAGGGGWYWWKKGGAGQAGQQQAGQGQRGGGGRVPVEVAEARQADLPIYLNGLGNVQAFNTVVIRSRVDGAIVKIAFREGQTVKQGEIIAQIDPRPYQATLDQAIAKKQQSEANLLNNRNNLDRTRQLAERGFAPQQQLDQQTSSVDSTTAQIAMDQAMIENARVQFGYTTIRAPISGRTGIRLIDEGNIVRASDQTGIVEIAQIEPISVLFTAPEGQLPAIARAMRDGGVKVLAMSTNGRETLGEGTLSLINNQVDPASGTVRLKAVFANKEDRLWPGLSINTRLLVETLKGVVAVPEDAVQRGPDQLFAFVIKDDGTADRRMLKVGQFTEGQAVIEDGLKPGERVVVQGQSRLQAGAKVEVVDPKNNSRSPDRAHSAAAPAQTTTR